jgi:hypothetical protein
VAGNFLRLEPKKAVTLVIFSFVFWVLIVYVPFLYLRPLMLEVFGGENIPERVLTIPYLDIIYTWPYNIDVIIYLFCGILIYLVFRRFWFFASLIVFAVETSYSFMFRDASYDSYPDWYVKIVANIFIPGFMIISAYICWRLHMRWNVKPDNKE